MSTSPQDAEAGCEVDRAPQHGGHAMGYFRSLKPELFAFLDSH